MRKQSRGPDPRKRAEKAARRKAVLAARGEPSPWSRSSLHRATAASTFAVGTSRVSESLFAVGMGYVVLGRTISPTKVAMAAFLLDVYCLGAKDGFFVEVDREKFEEMVEGMAQAAGPFVDIDPACVRKLVEGAVAYAERLGFAPHDDYAPAHALFGDINAAACPTAYAFGRDGKPCYIPGPHDTPARIRKILRTLTEKVGEGNFDYVLPFDGL